jgi:hypothetical protein
MPRNRIKRKNKIQNKPFYKIRQNGGAENNLEELEQLLTDNNKKLFDDRLLILTNYIKRDFTGMVLNEWEIGIHKDIQALLDKGSTIQELSRDEPQLRWLFRVTRERIFNLIREAQQKNIYNAHNYRNPS